VLITYLTHSPQLRRHSTALTCGLAPPHLHLRRSTAFLFLSHRLRAGLRVRSLAPQQVKASGGAKQAHSTREQDSAREHSAPCTLLKFDDVLSRSVTFVWADHFQLRHSAALLWLRLSHQQAGASEIFNAFGRAKQAKSLTRFKLLDILPRSAPFAHLEPRRHSTALNCGLAPHLHLRRSATASGLG